MKPILVDLFLIPPQRAQFYSIIVEWCFASQIPYQPDTSQCLTLLPPTSQNALIDCRRTITNESRYLREGRIGKS
jgi:hypothetical protein